MTTDRYHLLIRYKAALDNAWKKKDPLSLQMSEYNKTLESAKLAGFKVLRNSAGEHKLIDIGESDAMNILRETMAEYYLNK